MPPRWKITAGIWTHAHGFPATELNSLRPLSSPSRLLEASSCKWCPSLPSPSLKPRGGKGELFLN